jgi:hypothetical protein
MKSALGLVIPLITNDYPLSLIDEPEAFLHPPQARLIGHAMGSLVNANSSQIVVAAHDKNVLVGLVESGVPLTIVHLTRAENTTAATILESSDVAGLWKDVTLRYGDALDGLFHRAVIITESDRDSHFYAAAVEAEHAATRSDSAAHNLMFLSSHGKQNMAQYVTRLERLGVRTVSCPDLDILDNDKVLRPLVEAYQGVWADLEPDYAKATAQFRGAPKPPKAAQVQAAIETLFTTTSKDEDLSAALANAVIAAVKLPKSKWRELKDFGFSAFKADKAAATRLLDA